MKKGVKPAQVLIHYLETASVSGMPFEDVRDNGPRKELLSYVNDTLYAAIEIDSSDPNYSKRTEILANAYEHALDKITTNIQPIPRPEVSWIKRFLRFIFLDDGILESKAEKEYYRLHNVKSNFEQKLVEFKTDYQRIKLLRPSAENNSMEDPSQQANIASAQQHIETKASVKEPSKATTRETLNANSCDHNQGAEAAAKLKDELTSMKENDPNNAANNENLDTKSNNSLNP